MLRLSFFKKITSAALWRIKLRGTGGDVERPVQVGIV